MRRIIAAMGIVTSVLIGGVAYDVTVTAQPAMAAASSIFNDRGDGSDYSIGVITTDGVTHVVAPGGSYSSSRISAVQLWGNWECAEFSINYGSKFPVGTYGGGTVSIHDGWKFVHVDPHRATYSTHLC